MQYVDTVVCEDETAPVFAVREEEDCQSMKEVKRSRKHSKAFNVSFYCIYLATARSSKDRNLCLDGIGSVLCASGIYSLK